MKQLMFALVALILLAFAAPAIAGDHYVTDQIMDAVDMSADSVDLAATINTKIESQNKTATILYKEAPGLATLTDPTESVDQRARHVIGGGINVAKDNASTLHIGGGDLLRQGGKPSVS